MTEAAKVPAALEGLFGQLLDCDAHLYQHPEVMEEIVGPKRNRAVALARQVAMYLVRELTPMSLPQIGRELGDRDHTTVLYGIEKIAALFEKDDALRRQVLEIKTELYGNGQQRVETASGLRHA